MRKLVWGLLVLCCHQLGLAQVDVPKEDVHSFFEAIASGDHEKVLSFPPSYLQKMNTLGYYPLSLAVRHKHPQVLQVLLDRGANPNQINNDNLKTTALMQCSNVNHADMAQMLIKAGGDVDIVDKNGDPVIHWAAYFGQEELTQLLLDQNAKTNLASIHANGVMEVALKEWKSDIVALLLKNGVVLNHVSPGNQKLVEAVQQNDTSYIEKHINTNNANTIDGAGTPLLVNAAEQGQLEMVKILLHKGAEIDGLNATGHTALTRAIYFEKSEVVKFLWEQGADVNRTDNRFVLTPLIAAAIKNNSVIGRQLLEMGADVNQADRINTFSPLIWAVIYENEEFVAMILEYKPNRDLVTTYGTTAKEMTSNQAILNLLNTKK